MLKLFQTQRKIMKKRSETVVIEKEMNLAFSSVIYSDVELAFKAKDIGKKIDIIKEDIKNKLLSSQCLLSNKTFYVVQELTSIISDISLANIETSEIIISQQSDDDEKCHEIPTEAVEDSDVTYGKKMISEKSSLIGQRIESVFYAHGISCIVIKSKKGDYNIDIGGDTILEKGDVCFIKGDNEISKVLDKF